MLSIPPRRSIAFSTANPILSFLILTTLTIGFFSAREHLVILNVRDPNVALKAAPVLALINSLRVSFFCFILVFSFLFVF